MKIRLSVSLVAALFLTPIAGLAQTTIAALPYAISVPGVYFPFYEHVTHITHTHPFVVANSKMLGRLRLQYA
jgi:hypothetical protein